MVRFLQGHWKTMRVIEPDLLADLDSSEDDQQPAEQAIALPT
jgi:hypothetical protein